MASVLVADVIQLAFEDLGMIKAGETLSATLLANGLIYLQQMWQTWGGEQDTNYNNAIDTHVLTTATPNYTYGITANAPTLTAPTQPIRVLAWRFIASIFGGTGASVIANGGELISVEQFFAQVKDINSTAAIIPQIVAADMGYPLINLWIFPTPLASSGALYLYYSQALPTMSSSATNLTVPEGYPEAMHFNLAVAMYPQYRRQGGIPPELAANAQNTKASIVARNRLIRLGMAASMGQQQAAA